MARIDDLRNYLTDVANAIRAKKGTTEKITAEDFDMEINNLPNGDININGNINTYSVAPNMTINSGDFVSIKNKVPNMIQLKRLRIAESESWYHCYGVRSVLLDTNKFFLFYCWKPSSLWESNGYGVVCTIDNENITVGTEIELANRLSTMCHTKIAKISTSMVAIFYTSYDDYDSSSNKYVKNNIYGMLCSISGSSITIKKSDIVLTQNYPNSSVNDVWITQLNANKCLLTFTLNENYGGDSNYGAVHGLIITLSTSNITSSTVTVIRERKDSYDMNTTILLNSSKVLLCHAGSNTFLNVVSISSSEITVGTEYKVPTGSDMMRYNQYKKVNLLPISEYQALLICCPNNLYSMGGIILDISGTTVSSSTTYVTILDTKNINRDTFIYAISCLKSSDNIEILYSISSNGLKAYETCNFMDITIQSNNSLTINYNTNFYINAAQCVGNDSLYMLSDNKYFYTGTRKHAIDNLNEESMDVVCFIFDFATGEFIVPATKGEVLGVAKTTVSSEGNIDIYTP